ncbi:hypothetical protein ACFQMA_11320 [Halosimplex aquaticum]|uniref:Uncharacterized protein n=1 Tax=Halosimplex aquaticum TaxID=3026162 RepID=A0ABD5Y0H8_9EURY|nr:hypothetical protein [Halosimplex aquaticum]
MDDAAALRVTLRRCTAVLVVGLGMIVANTDPYDPSSSLGYPLAYLAIGYLAASLLAGLFRRPDSPSDIGDEGDADDGESDDGGDDRPPVGAYGGPW